MMCSEDNLPQAEPMDVEPTPPPTSNQLKLTANELYKKKLYRESIVVYSQCIELDPENAVFYSNRSAAYVMIHDFHSAINDCRKAIGLDSTSLKPYIRIAQCYLALGNTDESIAQLQSAKVLFSKNNNRQNVDTVELRLNTALKISSLLKQTEAYIQENKFRQALVSLDSICVLVEPPLSSKSTSVIAGVTRIDDVDLENISIKWRLIRAECMVQLRYLDEANKIASRILQGDKTNSEALTIRAKIQSLLESHPYTSIISLLSNALAYDPDNKKARYLMKELKLKEATKKEGNEAFSKQEWSVALDIYTKLVQEDQDNGMMKIKVLSNSAIVQSKLGLYEESIANCTLAIKTLEKLAFPTSFQNSDDVDISGEDMRGCIHANMFYKLVTRRADCYNKLEKYEESVRDYSLAGNIKPDDKEIKRALRNAQQALKISKRKDYYKILAIDRSATEKEITRGYRKQCLLYHPDKCAGLSDEEKEAATAKFKEVGEAYTVLSDPHKKSLFDNGHDIDGTSASDGHGFGGGRGGGMDADILNMFFAQQMGQQGGFGGGFGGGHRHSHFGGGDFF